MPKNHPAVSIEHRLVTDRQIPGHSICRAICICATCTSRDKKISKGNTEAKRITVVESEPRPTTLLQDSSTFVQDMDFDHSRRLHKKH